ncbi:hypothetical protein C6Y62_00965 [Hyphomicrobium sulfonivorans]|nr:hypothetical protein [Hyphomicrobium sulfonivorans]NSL70389.1 hypothetical protein [Hyphomicrobium sulfonivorans]
MTVSFQNLQRQDVRVPIALSGFGEANKKLKQQLSDVSVLV